MLNILQLIKDGWLIIKKSLCPHLLTRCHMPCLPHFQLQLCSMTENRNYMKQEISICQRTVAQCGLASSRRLLLALHSRRQYNKRQLQMTMWRSIWSLDLHHAEDGWNSVDVVLFLRWITTWVSPEIDYERKFQGGFGLFQLFWNILLLISGLV